MTQPYLGWPRPGRATKIWIQSVDCNLEQFGTQTPDTLPSTSEMDEVSFFCRNKSWNWLERVEWDFFTKSSPHFTVRMKTGTDWELVKQIMDAKTSWVTHQQIQQSPIFPFNRFILDYTAAVCSMGGHKSSVLILLYSCRFDSIKLTFTI